MKKRNGFVSNSSTTSFICKICGRNEAGYDASADDLGFKLCEESHEFCEHHLKDFKEDCFNEDEELKKEFCPICNLDIISDSQIIRFLEIKGMDFKIIKKEIKDRFKTYNELKKFFKENVN